MIYLDNAATTRMAPQVREAMLPCLSERLGILPPCIRWEQRAERQWTRREKQSGRSWGADGEEIYFTGSGTGSR